ncbi:MAG: NDP-hexose 2,3-dehydratase family protein [Bacteroidetes bacterium]|nr:NDP-hexose 2,3-dehydratase family protein [Bacteroidota bacterium]
MIKDEKKILFLNSAFTLENPFISTEDALEWLKKENKGIYVKIDEIKFSEMPDWYFDEGGNLRHNSGKFFSIEGINVRTNWGKVPEWSQPIINQPEVGYLGIITKKFNGILYFLMQAKIEPGNINYVQLSPTIQATRSNYSQVHKGKRPLYLEYFNGDKKSRVMLDQLQSEQGARFLKKRNRNVIIEVEDEIEVHENFRWLTLGQIKKMMMNDNVVNMDTRTVISGIPFDVENLNGKFDHSNLSKDIINSYIDTENCLNETDEIISWITRLKSKYDLDVKQIPLNKVARWTKDEYSIYHDDRKYFSVIAVNVHIDNREVKSWSQPLIKSAQEGIIAFLIKKINGIYHFLVQAKLEAGNFDIIELAPTLQCLTGNYRKGLSEYEPEFLDYVLNVKPEQILYSAFQSEEGGRFYREQNSNLIIEVDENFPVEVPENFIWMTLNQIQTFLKFNNYLNIEARSLISSVRFI